MDGLIEPLAIDPDELAGEAWAAMGRGSWNEALDLWQRLRQSFPERPEGYIWPIQVLWQNGRLDEADGMAAAALARFPQDPEVSVQMAWIATTRERWDEAQRWWAVARARAPDRLDCCLGELRALWRSSRFEEAEALAAEALERFPGNCDIQAERAWVAVNRGDWEEALARWRQVLTTDPGRGDTRVRLIQALRFLGRTGEAETAATKALAESPDDPQLLIEHVLVAADRLDWPVAAARLETARGSLENAGLFQSTSDAVEARRQAERDRAKATGPVADPDDPIPLADLMMAFESIGERCDLGAVQRHYGCEPLDLLRFAFSPLDELIDALQNRFDGIGDVDDTGFETYEGETLLKTAKYGLIFEAKIWDKGIAASFEGGALRIVRLNTPKKIEAFQEHHRQQLISLKRKLIEDLEEAKRIFVHANDDRTSEDDAVELLASLRTYGGDNSLLYVRPADAAHAAGTVTKLRDGLYLGYYPRRTDFVAGEQPPFEVWRKLLQRTYRLARMGPRPRRAAIVRAVASLVGRAR
ncbi:MAG TPA: tetratricopeptide repeat protein [Stellaceae bacterium]|nr:tetratricopeptide repeat protein [Stellaceae bacterium]